MEEQIFGLMLVVVVSYSVQLDHFVQLPPTDQLAVVGINFFLRVGHLTTLSNVLLVATWYYLLHHVSTRKFGCTRTFILFIFEYLV